MLQFTFQTGFRGFVRFAASLWTFTICNLVAAAEPYTAFSFDGPNTTWQIEEGGETGRVLSHECATGGARDAAGFERVVVAASGGKSVRLICATAHVEVIDELDVRIWVKASRPDIQLTARVVLPRTASAVSPSASRVIVRGERYRRTGHWQQLVLNNVPKQLETEVRLLRSASDAEIDWREAFVDAIVLIVPGEPQGIEVATDDLVVDGVVRSVSDRIQRTSYPAPASGSSSPASATRSVPASLRRLPDSTSSDVAPTEEVNVRLHGELLLVNDKPLLARAIQYQGEPLQTLAELGFNVVWLNRAPTAEETLAARKFGLWFLGMPPRPEALMNGGLGEQGDRVVAWCLDDTAVESDPNYASRWANLVRERDAVTGRPVVIAPHDDWSSANKEADILMAARPRLGLVPSAEYDNWLTGRTPFVRPGTPVWACYPSQFDAAVGRQISLLGGDPTAASPNVPSAQLQSLVDVACSRGIRGIAFLSETPLSETDAATRARATTLELINRRIQRLEPWLASGKVFGRFPSADAAWSGVVLHVHGAQLLIPLGHAASRDKSAVSVPEDVTFVVPGVPESCQVFLLTPVAMKTLPVERVAGGTRFAMRPDDDAFVLMTADPKVIQSMRQHMARHGERMVQLLRESAALKAAAILETARRLKQNGIDCAAAGQAMTNAAMQLQQIDVALASKRVEQAYQLASVANRTLDQSAGELRQTIAMPTTPYSNALALGDENLAELAAFERTRPTLHFGENLLYGGDFEDVGQLTQIGWQHSKAEIPGIESRSELSVVEPRHGTYCLLLQAAASDAARVEPGVTPVWIDSPPMAVSEGQVLEISGWVRVEPPAPNTGDGLQIVDSLGGPDLALTVRQTNGWERFHIIRAVPESTELRLSFALSGLGAVQLDAVMVRPLEQPAIRRLPVLNPANGDAAESTPTAAGPLFIIPQPR